MAVTSTSWNERMEKILNQDRHVLNFQDYSVSQEHSQRMETLAKKAPHLYDNPEITPRSKWFSHPRYSQNAQMPPFHIHFRQEMQVVLKSLNEATKVVVTAQPHRHIKNALRTFSGCMRGLNGHVSIEEYACFPLYKGEYPEVDIDFLFHDHKSLKQAEGAVEKELKNLFQQETITPEMLLNCVTTVLDFDDQLMSHLGEEEEIVVPMSLTEKDIWF